MATVPGSKISIVDSSIPLPQLGPDPTPERIADFLQTYSEIEVNDLAAAIADRFPHLPFSNDTKHAVVSGWLRGEMDLAAFALRHYSMVREMHALRRSA